MKTSRPTDRKLKVENLEDRCLTASLATTALGPTTSSFQTAYELSGQTSGLTPTPALVRSYDWVSGLTRNHNETLVSHQRLASRQR